MPKYEETLPFPLDLISDLERNVPAEQLLKLGHRMSAKRGSTLFKSSSGGKYILYIETGKAAINYIDMRGHSMLVSYVYPGDLIDEITTAHYLRNIEIQVRAVSDCVIRRIPQKEFWLKARSKPQLYGLIIGQISSRLLRTSCRMMDMATQEVRYRIASVLRDLTEAPDAKSHPRGHLIRTTRNALSKMVGCTRESAGKAVKNLEELGCMEAKGKTMLIYKDGFKKLETQRLREEKQKRKRQSGQKDGQDDSER